MSATTKAALQFQPTLEATDELIRNLLDDNGNQLSDAAFFSKLQELRREHKRTLKLLEDLYKQKLFEKTGDDGFQYRMAKIGEPMQKKREDRRGDVRFVDSDTIYGKGRRSSEPFFNDPVPEWNANDQDDSESMAGSYISDSYFPEDWDTVSFQGKLVSREAYSPDSAAAAEKVSKPEDKRRNTIAQDERRNEIEILGRSWNPKPTVPQPFWMTIRDEIAPIKASYSQNFLQQFLKEEEEKEKVEPGFKAKPVPPSTHMPLYEEQLKRDVERRRFVREYSKEMLKVKVKPFNLTTSFNGNRHNRRCSSMSDLRLSSEGFNSVPPFKARPVPNYVKSGKSDGNASASNKSAPKFDNAGKQFNNSKWPPNAQALSHSTIRKALQSKRRHQQQQVANVCTFKPEITRNVPDFEALHKEFQRSMDEAKMKASRVTVPEPFDLRIDSRKLLPQNHDTHKDCVKRFHTAARRSRSMTNLNASMEKKRTAESEQTAMVKANTAALLREAAIRRRLNEIEKRGKQLLQNWRRKEMEGMKMRQTMRAKTIEYDMAREASERERTEQRRLAIQSGQELYDQFKLSISEKISERKSLLDRQNLITAKQSIDKRYRKALESAGLKGVSVDTAMASIEKLLSQDKKAASAVSALIEEPRSVESLADRSSRSASSSESVTSENGSGIGGESASSSPAVSAITVASKKASARNGSAGNISESESAKKSDQSSESEGGNYHGSAEVSQKRNSSDVKDMYDD